jgi:hypothetical protein
VLGADAQTTAWAQATVDFPQFHPQCGAGTFAPPAGGPDDLLHADVLKVSHHASKHGINLELVERMAPQLALISSLGGGGTYGFRHALATEALREAAQPTASRGTLRKPDHDLGTSALRHRSARWPSWSPPSGGPGCGCGGSATGHGPRGPALGREMTRLRAP